MHPHDPDRAAPVGRAVSGDGGSSELRPFTMPVERPGYGKLVMLIGFVVIAVVVGQSLFRRWRWTSSGTGRIEVAVNPEDAVITLDGEPPRRSPATAIVHAGGHTLVVEREGYARVEQRIDVNPGETVEVPVSLMAIPPPPPVSRLAPERPSPHARHASPARAVRATGISYVDTKTGHVR